MDSFKQLENLGYQVVEEFFETMIMMYAMEKSHEIISEYTKDIKDPYLKEAVESALNVLTFGGIFMIIQYEEKIIEYIFNLVSGSVGVLMNMPKKTISRLKSLKGRKLSIMSKILGNFSDDGVKKSQVIVTQLGNFIQGRNNQYQSIKLVEGAQDIRKGVYDREKIAVNLVSSVTQNYHRSMIFKLLTSSFSQNDKTILKKILGTYDPDKIDVEDLNKIASFMFVKDSEGKIVGLSQAFLELVNGLGYINK